MIRGKFLAREGCDPLTLGEPVTTEVLVPALILTACVRILKKEQNILAIECQPITPTLMTRAIFEGFRQVIIAGARFTGFLIYLSWSLRQVVELRPAEIAQGRKDLLGAQAATSAP